MESVLVASGLVLVGLAGWRSYGAAREALGPLVHDGEPTRRAIEASRPFHARPRLRHVLGRVVLALGWLVVASYGLVLLSAGLAPGSLRP
ncbi:MAG TPA: hypothetical protein VNJ28_08440 [Candidatus Limnocylindrales bacterium]|nr:hypothetical protein [Candidatus Limnocylindrales bacterium]